MPEAANVPAPSPHAVVAHMLAGDAVTRWLGAEVLEAAAGRSVLRMVVREDFVNGFGTVHGGITFALADSAFAFATNAGGFISVAVDCTISFPAAVRPGDVLVATAVEQVTTNRLAFCEVNVTNQHEQPVAFFRGTVYRTTRPHALAPAEQATGGSAA